MALNKDFVNSYANKKVPWGPIGYVTYKRTYARGDEEWHDTIERCVNGILDLGCDLSKAEAERLFDHVFNLRCCFSGRALWQLGTPTMRRIGADSLNNCWMVSVNNLDAFTFLFTESMLGGGVAFNIQKHNVYGLPKIVHSPSIIHKDSYDVDYLVPDNREGWVDLLRKILNSFFITGKSFSYSTKCIRPFGSPITSFGGTASGPKELLIGMGEIITVLQKAYGRKLEPVETMDIMNIIGKIVVSGNVRRSAELALGDADDLSYLKAKRWDLGQIPNWRSMSNNSVVRPDEFLEEFWDGYDGKGEPYGIVDLKAMRNYGRFKDESSEFCDPYIDGCNPCAEIGLEPYEPCNLSEIFLPNIRTLKEFEDAAILLYKVNKTICNVPFLHEETNKVVKRNQRIGISLTGILQSNWDDYNFDYVYNKLRAFDIAFSKVHGINQSIKLTTVQPSGTKSLLAGVTSGVHPAFSEYYIRRVRMSSDSPLISLCHDKGYHVEPQINFDGTTSLNTSVVSFPVHHKDALYVHQVSLKDQVALQSKMQYYWADNAVSVTNYYRPNELKDVIDVIENYKYKSISFLRQLDHGFKQAPLEQITKEQYNEMKREPIDRAKGSLTESIDNIDGCEGGACPVR